MATSRMNNALAIGLNLYISKEGLRWIGNNDPDLLKQIKQYKRKRNRGEYLVKP